MNTIGITFNHKQIPATVSRTELTKLRKLVEEQILPPFCID
jgi:hypothetical protein